MACRITELILDVRDPERLARFWCDVLGYVELERDGEDVVIGPPGASFGGPQPVMILSQTDQPKLEKLRLHLDVSATDRSQEEELARLLAAGARHVDIGQTGEESWYVLADPEGNEFCLLAGRVAAL
ncbi:MAG TPA: VOC family protein [Natronosporangium sp.]